MTTSTTAYYNRLSLSLFNIIFLILFSVVISMNGLCFDKTISYLFELLFYCAIKKNNKQITQHHKFHRDIQWIKAINDTQHN
jgi:hypothetical protein